MRILATLLWQIAVVLLLLIANWTTAATLVAGALIGFWFCVINIAITLGRLER